MRALQNGAFVALVVVLATACGGGGGGSGSTTTTLPALASWCGGLSASGSWDQGDVAIGDEAHNAGSRGFLVFDLAPLPTGATVTNARLRVDECGHTGTPYADLGGSLLVDHVDVGISIDAADYKGGGLTVPIGPISTRTEWVCTPREMDVTTQVQADVTAGRLRSAYRFYFSSESNVDDEADWVGLANMLSGMGPSDPQPVIYVTYTQ